MNDAIERGAVCAIVHAGEFDIQTDSFSLKF
jgi:hypothetical protein